MIQTSPQVVVLHGHHLSVAFPLPAAFAPFGDSVVQTATDVGTGFEQSDPRWLFKGFQTTDDGQQLQAFAAADRFRISGFEMALAIGSFEHEAPIAILFPTAAFSQQQKVGCGRHACSQMVTVGRDVQDGIATNQFCLSSQFAYVDHSTWSEEPLLSATCIVTIGGVSNFDSMGTAFNFVPTSLEEELRRRFAVVEHRLAIGGRTYELRHPRSADELICEEEFNRDERLPYWAEIWPSAYVLAQRIAGEQGVADGRPRRLLELGCGSGLAVMTALAAGFEVTAVDYYPEALEFVRLNAALNGLPAPTVQIVDWRQYPRELIEFDIVVAADVLYETRLLPTDGRGVQTITVH